MKIIYHHRTMGRSSQGMHIRSMIEAFEAAGHKVVVVSPPGVDPRKTAGEMPFLRQTDRAEGIHKLWRSISCHCPQLLFEFCELFYNLVIPFRLLPALWREPEAQLYERHAYFMFMSALLAKLFGRTVIVEVNELAGFKRARGLIMYRLARWMDTCIFSLADHMVCVSGVLTRAIKASGIDEGRVHVVPNAIDPDRFQRSYSGQAIREQYDLSQSLVIGHVGLFHCWDRLDVLIQVLNGTRQRYPQLKLFLVGDGPEYENLQATTKRLELNNIVVFAGPVNRDDVPAYIDAMDICVLPDSNAFASPIALFEFMAMGKACVVPDLPPMLDVIKPNVTGIVFPHGDYHSLEHAIVRLVENLELRIQIGVRAKQVVYSSHTWSANARFAVELFTSRVAGRSDLDSSLAPVNETSSLRSSN